MSNREQDEKDYSRENSAVVNREQRRIDNIRANAESAENMMHKVAKDALKNKDTKSNLAQDFLQKFRGDQQPDRNLIDFLRKSAGGDGGGVNNADYEPDPTGMEELPWDKE